VCNLYSVTKPQAAIRELAKAMVDGSGNLSPIPAAFPDQMAPVVMTRPSDGKRELPMMRWGFPLPHSAMSQLVTNVRNTNNTWWRPYLRPRYRCLPPWIAGRGGLARLAATGERLAAIRGVAYRIGWGTWARTTITAVKVRCPTVRRSPNKFQSRVTCTGRPLTRDSKGLTILLVAHCWFGRDRR
jgi:hypothetical protein